MSVSEKIFNFISQMTHLAFGRNRLALYERLCIDAWRSTLSESFQKKLDNQLANFNLVQRQARKTKTVFYDIRDPGYRSWDDKLFPIPNKDLKVFSGKLTGRIGDVCESIDFCIYVHRGRLSSIEFSSEPGFLASVKHLDIKEPKTLVDFKQ